MGTNAKDISKEQLAIQTFEANYKGRLGKIGGYVAKDLEVIGKWLSNQVELAYKKNREVILVYYRQ